MGCQPAQRDSLQSRLFGAAGSAHLGLWAFAATPFTPAGELDDEALAGYIAQIYGPADCVVAMGAIAEVDFLTDDEWRRCLEVAGAVVPATTPLIVGLPGDGERAARLASAVDHSRADAILAPLGDGDPITHVRTIADGSGRPVIPYLRQAIHAEPHVLEGLIATDVVVGLKDGLRDPVGFRSLRTALGSVPVSAAWEDVALGYWAYGVDAVSPASAVHDPAYARGWIDALAEPGPREAGRRLDLFGHPFSDLRRSRPGLDLACVKYALALRGHGTAVTRASTTELTEPERLEVRRLLDAIDGMGPTAGG
jgi:dihydrodipicolinate synthase/N-acetylneuraminate lyase